MVKIYTLDGCPKCEILKKKLAQHKVEFNECKDREAMALLGIAACPVLEVNGQLLRYAQAVSWVNNGGK